LTEELLSTFSLSGARRFAEKYKAASSEKRLGQSFWRDFFTQVVAIEDLMSAGIEFEYPVRSASGTINFIDVFWPAVLLIEQKSEGKSLDDAEKQARDYLIALSPALRPPTIVVSDFKRIRIVEVLAGNTFEFTLDSIVENLPRLELAIGKLAFEATKPELSADQKAVELMADLFVEFEKAGYGGHELSVFLVRILFLNFGDDTRMWKRTTRGMFADFIEATSADGMGVGGRLQELFQVLNTPNDKRPSTLSPTLVDFPYVNGGLFSEQLPVFSFTAEMREALRRTTEYDWSKISPAIFGAMFQTVKSKEERRSLGEHYTSEANILKVIRPLFLDEFTERLQKAWDTPSALKKFHAELATYDYLDPACGSGNFLVVAYKRLRDIELKLMARLQELEGRQGDVFLDGRMGLSITLDQFHGIEINEWSSQIATVAMYLADHQANLEMEEVTGFSPHTFPLTTSAAIFHGNALALDWSSVCPIRLTTFIMGNPPFLGQSQQDQQQKEDTRAVWRNHPKTGVMDFVSNWYLLAARQMEKTGGSAAFVSTNSIAQGEQVPPLWQELSRYGMEIDFAHRTFNWTNEAAGKAAVHCVIVGFSRQSTKKSAKKRLWEYETPNSTPQLRIVPQINPYLIAGPEIAIESRTRPISDELVPLIWGSKPTDNGNLSKISKEEADRIREDDGIAAQYLRPIIGAQELIHGAERYCLWLEDASPQDLRNSPEIRKRVDAVQQFRLSSTAELTRRNARIPHLFVQRAQPKTEYIGVPLHSSVDRNYLPIAWVNPKIVALNSLSTIPQPNKALFAVLNSNVFNLWAKTVSGRIKSDIRISAEITYNNFPLRHLSQEERATLERTGQAILDARAMFEDSSLADLYGSSSMPLDLITAHKQNDKAVLKIFDLRPDASDDAILACLFFVYGEMTRGLLPAQRVRKTGKVQIS
jgi:hypothetical protein